MKSCGECKECCTGALKVEVKNFIVEKGKNCPFLNKKETDKGCSIYSERPGQCIKYQCWWKLNDDIPDFMRPDISKILVTNKTAKQFDYLDVIAVANHQMPYEGLSHVLKYAVLTKKNIIWRKNNYEKDVKVFWLGSSEFIDSVNKDQFSFNQFSTDLYG